MQGAMKDFYPLVMESIALQPEPQRRAYQLAEEKGEVFTGVADGIHNREMYTEVIKAQVKVSHRRAMTLLVAVLTLDSRQWPFLLMCYGAPLTTSAITSISSLKHVFAFSEIVRQKMSQLERSVALSRLNRLNCLTDCILLCHTGAAYRHQAHAVLGFPHSVRAVHRYAAR
jgi:hypothetical protein